MLMHRVTFPMLAWVSLDAADVLTEGPPETGGKPKIPVHRLFLPHSIFILQNEKKIKMRRRLVMLPQDFYHKLAG